MPASRARAEDDKHKVRAEAADIIADIARPFGLRRDWLRQSHCWVVSTHMPGVNEATNLKPIETVATPTAADVMNAKRLLLVRCATEDPDAPVQLKLTLTAKFLPRPFVDAVVVPFLRAYAKKAPGGVSTDDVEDVVIDGVPTAELSMAAGELLPLGDDIRVEIRLRGATTMSGTSRCTNFDEPGDSKFDWRDAARSVFAISAADARSWVLSKPAERLETTSLERIEPTGSAPHVLLEAAAAGVAEVPLTLGAAEGVATRAILFHPTAGAASVAGWPLVMLLPGAHEHARSATTLWHAWRLVLEWRCVVLAIDAVPHHGVRSPDGSNDASRHANWPQPFLADGVAPWCDAHFDGTLSRAASEVRYALDIALALPSATASATHQAGGLAKLATQLLGMPRRTLRPPDGPRLVDITKIHLMAYGIGALLGTAALALEERTARCRIGAAVLGHFCHSFPWRDVPGCVPSPSHDAFEARVLNDAHRVLTPVLLVAHDNDEQVPLARAQKLLNEFKSTKKRLRTLPGSGGTMSVASLRAQEAWVFATAADVYQQLS